MEQSLVEKWNREEMLNMLVTLFRVDDLHQRESMSKSLCYYLSFNGEVPIDFL